MKRRLLPDACYDFFVTDGRDGERWGPFDTPGEAKRVCGERRRTVDPWARSVFYVEREVSERKVLKLLRPTPDEETKR